MKIVATIKERTTTALKNKIIIQTTVRVKTVIVIIKAFKFFKKNYNYNQKKNYNYSSLDFLEK